MNEYHVEYIRTPYEERLVLKNPKYLGRRLVWNMKHRKPIETELWVVDYVRVDERDLETPRTGILQIQSYRWQEAALDSNPENLAGTVEIVADRRYHIVSVRNNLR